MVGEPDRDHPLDLVQPGDQVDLPLYRVGLDHGHDLAVGEHAVHLDSGHRLDAFGHGGAATGQTADNNP